MNTPASASLPARGAWVEICRLMGISLPPQSLPARGAWVEMMLHLPRPTSLTVAPRTGSVG